MKRFLRRTIVTFLVTLIAASTVNAQVVDDKQLPNRGDRAVENPSPAKRQWSYHGDTGPDHWADLDPAFAAARDGRAQSPIDIKVDSARAAKLPPVKLAFRRPADLKVFNNGHAIQADVPEGVGSLSIGRETFGLAQFHFHMPSEHLVNGKQFAGELHMVHEAEEGTLAVVGVFIEQGAAHKELAKIWARLPKPARDGHGKGRERAVAAFDLETLLPDDLSSYRYTGSLTTPPCSEGVKWTVLAKPIEMSEAQIRAFTAMFSGKRFPDGNRRPCQPLNGRIVQTDVED